MASKGEEQKMLAKYYDSMLPGPLDVFSTFKLLDDLYLAPESKSKASAYRVEADDNELTLSVDLPGVKLSDLQVTAQGREVRVSGKLRGQDFKHTYKVSKDYDTETIDALLEDGVLVLKFKKSSFTGEKKIEVKTKSI